MIVWVLMSAYIGILILVYRKKEEISKKDITLVAAGFLVLFSLCIICNGRSYTSSNFHANYAARMCKITHEKDNVIVNAPDSRTFVVSKDSVVTYEAPDKNSETVEVTGQARNYTPDAPAFLYEMYFLEKPAPSTEYVVESVNLSVAK